MTKDEEKRKYEYKTVCKILSIMKIDSGSLINQEPPEPDFILNENNIGIELTRYTKSLNSINYSREIYIKKFIQEMQDDYVLKNGSLSVYITFTKLGLQILEDKKSTVKKVELRNQIISFVLKHKEEPFDRYTLPIPMIKYIKNFDVYNNEDDIVWQYVTAGYITPDVDNIVRIIDNKDSKISNYKKVYKEKWLIITSSSGCCIGIPNKEDTFFNCFMYKPFLAETKYRTNFDKVILYDFTGKVYSLPLS